LLFYHYYLMGFENLPTDGPTNGIIARNNENCSRSMIDDLVYLLLQSDATLGLRQPEANDGVRAGRGAVKLRVSERGM
jgi:hypothetical protein